MYVGRTTSGVTMFVTLWWRWIRSVGAWSVLLGGESVGPSNYWCRQAFPYVFVCPCLLLHVDHPRVGYFNLCYQTVMNRSLHCLCFQANSLPFFVVSWWWNWGSINSPGRWLIEWLELWKRIPIILFYLFLLLSILGDFTHFWWDLRKSVAWYAWFKQEKAI